VSDVTGMWAKCQINLETLQAMRYQ